MKKEMSSNKQMILLGILTGVLIIFALFLGRYLGQVRQKANLLALYQQDNIVDITDDEIITLEKTEKDFQLTFYSREDAQLSAFYTITASPSTTTVVNPYLYFDRKTNSAHVLNITDSSYAHYSVSIENILSEWVDKGQDHQGPVFKLKDGSYKLCNVEKNGQLEPFDYQENY